MTHQYIMKIEKIFQVTLMKILYSNHKLFFNSRHFQLNPILILEFDIGVRIMFLVDILKDNM